MQSAKKGDWVRLTADFRAPTLTYPLTIFKGTLGVVTNADLLQREGQPFQVNVAFRGIQDGPEGYTFRTPCNILEPTDAPSALPFTARW